MRLRFLMRVLHTNDSSLAQNFAVLLSRDFLGHLENHFHQSVFWEALWSVQQHSRLAQVLDGAFTPGPQVLHPVPDLRIHLDSARPWHPGNFARVRPAFRGRGSLWRLVIQPFYAAHGCPVVFVFGGAQKTHLVVLAIGGAAW